MGVMRRDAPPVRHARENPAACFLGRGFYAGPARLPGRTGHFRGGAHGRRRTELYFPGGPFDGIVYLEEPGVLPGRPVFWLIKENV